MANQGGEDGMAREGGVNSSKIDGGRAQGRVVRTVGVGAAEGGSCAGMTAVADRGRGGDGGAAGTVVGMTSGGTATSSGVERQ